MLDRSFRNAIFGTFELSAHDQVTIIKGKKPVFLYIKYNEILVKLHTKVSIQILTIEDDEDPDIL